MAYIDHIKACNTRDFSGYREFWVGGDRVGWVRHALAERLESWPDLLTVTKDRVCLDRRFVGFAERTAAMDQVVDRLIAEGVIPRRRRERYPVLAGGWGTEALLTLDRGAVTYFGIAAFGIHVNGFVRYPDGDLALWIGQRARTCSVAPLKYDNMIAGGQPYGLSLEQNLIKEAYEEAGIASNVVARAAPVGIVTYIMDTPPGLKVDCLFIYDLPLAPEIHPSNTDGEVERFELMPWRKVAAIVEESDGFKFNCNLVVLDFLIRHGLLTPAHPDYLSIAAGLRRWG